MLRVIRTTVLRQLQEDVESYSDEAESWHRHYTGETERAEAAEATIEVLNADLEEAGDQLAAAEAALGKLRADQDRVECELKVLRAQHLLDTEDRAALRTLLRIVRKQQDRADRVYVLFRRGELHSVHATHEGAEAAAEAEGAPRSGWTTPAPGAALPPAAEVAWRVQPLPLGSAH
jgi:chromosome segregation ATPase